MSLLEEPYSKGYGVAPGLAAFPYTIRTKTTNTTFFATAEVLSFQGHAPLPPPCRALLKCEQAYPCDAPSPPWLFIYERREFSSTFCSFSDIHFLLGPLEGRYTPCRSFGSNCGICRESDQFSLHGAERGTRKSPIRECC